jgi:hypothetical protein
MFFISRLGFILSLINPKRINLYMIKSRVVAIIKANFSINIKFSAIENELTKIPSDHFDTTQILKRIP